jgi:hypothetical protein
VPENVAPLKVAIPLAAVAVRVPPRVPPEPEAMLMVTTVLESLVTVLPPTSWIVTTGCVVKAAPEAPVTGAVVRTSCVAGPAIEIWRLPEVALVKPEASKSKV